MMKNFLILLFAFIAIPFFSQDSLLMKNGEIKTGIIREDDGTFLSLSSLDSSVKEIQLIAKNSLLCLRRNNGEIQQFFKNDTLIFNNAKISPCNISIIGSESVTCNIIVGMRLNQYIVNKSDLLLIKLANGSIEQVHTFQNNSAQTLYESGLNDANTYYKVNPGMMVGTYFCGLTSFMLYPLVGGIVIAASKPTNLTSIKNPNNHLLMENPSYKIGYEEAAKKIKRKKAFGTFMAGIGTSVVFWVTIISLNL